MPGGEQEGALWGLGLLTGPRELRPCPGTAVGAWLQCALGALGTLGKVTTGKSNNTHIRGLWAVVQGRESMTGGLSVRGPSLPYCLDSKKQVCRTLE